MRTRSSISPPRVLRLFVVLAVVAVLAGCGGAGVTLPTAHDEAPPAARTVTVFFVKGEQFAPRTRAVPPRAETAAAALAALLAGPTASERAAGIDTTIPPRTELAAVEVRDGTATVELMRADATSTALDLSLRPARAAQIVYTLTAVPGIEQVLIRVNGVERVSLIGSKLALRGPLDKHDLSRPVTLPAKPAQVPSGPAPADPRGVQARLVSLGYLPGDAVSGTWDARTSHAVSAFQAWQRLDPDGIVGAQTLAALESAARPKPGAVMAGRHVEVYRDKGVTLLVEGTAVVRALHSSTGAPGFETPAGTYSIFRKERSSWSVPYQVWLPYASYFNGGIAFHAYADVPARPASHGCVRLPAAEAPFAYDFMSIGTPVTVY